MNTPSLTSSTSTDPSWPADALSKAWVERIFEVMQASYGRKFGEQWGNGDPTSTMRHWATKLAGYTAAEIKRGVDLLDTRDWPPTLPEFLKFCRPGLDPVVAWYEAVNGCEARAHGKPGEWTSAAIFWAAQEVGPYDIRTQGYSAMASRWQAALAKAVKRTDLPPIPEPSISIPAPGQTMASREQAEAHLQQLGAAGALKRTTEKAVGSKDWAHKVLTRNDVPYIAKKFAREALGIAE